MRGPLQPETRNLLLLVAGTGITAILALAYVVATGRALGPAGYGDFAAALAIVNLVALALGPINAVVTRFTTRYRVDGLTGRVLSLRSGVRGRITRYGLPLLVVGALLSLPIARALRLTLASTVPVCGLIVLAALLLNVDRGVLRGLERFGSHNLSTISEAGLRLTLGLPLLLLAPTAVNALVAYLAATLLALALAHRQIRSALAGVQPVAVDRAELRAFIPPMFLFAFVSAALQNVNMLFAKSLLAAEGAGHYGAATTLAGTFSVLFWPFSLLALPWFSALARVDRPVTGPLVKVAVQFLALAAVPLALLGAFPRQILSLLYGPGFTPAAPLLLPLAAATVCGFLAILVAQVYTARGHFRFLWIFAAGLTLELAGLTLFNDSGPELARVVLAAKALTLAAMWIYFFFAPKPR